MSTTQFSQENATTADQNEDQEPELVELHFELEMDHHHGTTLRLHLFF